MAKVKSTFFCSECGYESPKWQGKCPSCNSWNTFNEEIIIKEDQKPFGWKSNNSEKRRSKPTPISKIKNNELERIITLDNELNRVLGGGIVPGSLTLLGGEPGIGKSTLLLQFSLFQPGKILYVSGEESEQQIKMRASRIKQILPDNCYILAETNTENIFQHAEDIQPEILIIDSIQTLHSSKIDSTPGTISQVRECTGELMKFAKETNTPVFLVGHITKDGAIAGPKLLEHMVDTVLQFEGDRHMTYRIVRTIKNRFGSTSELGIYEMKADGLRQVSNPSELLINQRDMRLSGVTIAASQEGNRPLLIEIQALVSPATYGNPQRTATGFDNRRLNMLLAVLEKRTGFRLSSQDVFLNLAGGIKVDDPAIDLAICTAIVSSFEEIEIPDKICFAAEVGLGGEIRAVNQIQSRISEAEKLGFEMIYISGYNKVETKNYKIKIASFTKLSDVISDLMG